MRLRLVYFQFHTFCSIALFGLFPRTLLATCCMVFSCFPDDWFPLSFESIKIYVFDVICHCVEQFTLLLCFLNPHKWFHLCEMWRLTDCLHIFLDMTIIIINSVDCANWSRRIWIVKSSICFNLIWNCLDPKRRRLSGKKNINRNEA